MQDLRAFPPHVFWCEYTSDLIWIFTEPQFPAHVNIAPQTPPRTVSRVQGSSGPTSLRTGSLLLTNQETRPPIQQSRAINPTDTTLSQPRRSMNFKVLKLSFQPLRRYDQVNFEAPPVRIRWQPGPARARHQLERSNNTAGHVTRSPGGNQAQFPAISPLRPSRHCSPASPSHQAIKTRLLHRSTPTRLLTRSTEVNQVQNLANPPQQRPHASIALQRFVLPGLTPQQVVRVPAFISRSRQSRYPAIQPQRTAPVSFASHHPSSTVS